MHSAHSDAARSVAPSTTCRLVQDGTRWRPRVEGEAAAAGAGRAAGRAAPEAAARLTQRSCEGCSTPRPLAPPLQARYRTGRTAGRCGAGSRRSAGGGGGAGADKGPMQVTSPPPPAHCQAVSPSPPFCCARTHLAQVHLVIHKARHLSWREKEKQASARQAAASAHLRASCSRRTFAARVCSSQAPVRTCNAPNRPSKCRAPPQARSGTARRLPPAPGAVVRRGLRGERLGGGGHAWCRPWEGRKGDHAISQMPLMLTLEGEVD